MEAEVADLKRRPAAIRAAADWVEQITGSVRDVEAFEEISRLGANTGRRIDRGVTRTHFMQINGVCSF